MAKQVNEIIAKRGYDLIGNLDDETDVIWSFENEYDGSTYIGDAISEIADGATPIYSNDIWENAKDIRENIEEAVGQGLTEGVTDIEKILQAGYYQYYTQTLYDNLETMVYNIMAQKVNEALAEIENPTDWDVNEIEDDIESKVSEIDNNNRFDDIQDAVDEIIEAIKNRDDYEVEEA